MTTEQLLKIFVKLFVLDCMPVRVKFRKFLIDNFRNILNFWFHLAEEWPFFAWSHRIDQKPRQYRDISKSCMKNMTRAISWNNDFLSNFCWGWCHFTGKTLWDQRKIDSFGRLLVFAKLYLPGPVRDMRSGEIGRLRRPKWGNGVSTHYQ